MIRQLLWGSVFFLLLFSLFACRQQESVQSAGGGDGALVARPGAELPVPLLSGNMEIRRHEIDVEALADFVPHRGKTLVFLSNDPSLVPIPGNMRQELDATVQQGGKELRRRMGRVADTLLLPGMLISGVLETRIFNRVVWVLPTAGPEERIELEKFKALLASLDFSGSETFRREPDGTLTGEIGGIRFDVVHAAALPPIRGPVVVHLDLSYFAAAYKNAIKTPLIPLVGETLKSLRKTTWPVSAVTFSYSNHSGQVPLTFRPLGAIVQQLFAAPQLLDAPMPENWKLFGDVLYLESFFQNNEIMRVLSKMEVNEPNAAWVKYLRSNFSRHLKETEIAERYLDAAVKGDAGYALEYLNIAVTAREQKKSEQYVANIRKLIKIFPEDPFFRLLLCEELVEQKNFKEARTYLPSLIQLPWSPTYYPEVPPTLEYLRKASE